MTGFGVLLIILGLGSLLLPMLNIQFTLMTALDAYQPWAGILTALIGVVLAAIPIMRARQAAMAAPTSASPSGAAPAAEASASPAATPAAAAPDSSPAADDSPV
jgi:hypothetical protein